MKFKHVFMFYEKKIARQSTLKPYNRQFAMYYGKEGSNECFLSDTCRHFNTPGYFVNAIYR